MLLCSTIFGQITPKYNYVEDGTYQHSMILTAVIEFDGVEQINPNLELGVFSGNELRGGAFVEEIAGRYYARPVIYGQSGQFFTFKVYDHTTGIEIEREWSVGSTFTYGGSTMEYMSYNSYGYGNFSQPAVIDFVTPNHWIPNHNVYENNYDVIAVVLIDDIEQAGQDAVNLELGAFSVSDGTVRGSVKLNSQTILGNTRYYADMLVYGNENDKITFRLYNHATKQELQFNDVNTCTLIEANDATGNPILGSYIKPVEVNFITEPYVAQIGDKNYTSLEKAIAAAQAGDVVKVFAGTYPLPSMKAGITIEGAVDENGEVKVLFEGTLTSTLEDLTLKNIHIRGGNAQRWAYAKGDLTFVNVIFEATSVYALHFDGITEGTNLLYEDCTIIGWAAMGGNPESCKFIGCTIKDNGTYGVIRTYFDTTIEECIFDVNGANPNDNFQDGIHAVEGAYVIVNGCTNVNGTMKDIVNIHAMSVVSIDGVEIKHLAKIGDNYYFTLAEAFAAAQDGETVQLLADLTLDSETYTIADGKSVTLDMNGKKITVTDNKTINYELFYIYGGLTVIGDGTIELTATNDRDWNAMSAIFHNRGGVLTINNGTFKHLGGTDMAYVVDNSGNYYGDATTNINNGTLASTYIAIRNRMEQNTHGASGKAILNVANGSISGTSRAIWAQAASTSDTAPATGEINISGGTIGLIDTPRSTGAVSMTTISGGTVSAFQGEVNELKVTGGTLNDVTIMDASGNEIDYAVNKDGLYVAAVAKIGDKGYVSIQAAVNEAQDGNTVIVKEGKYNVFCPKGSDDNYTGSAHNLFVGKSITIKGEEDKEVVIYSYQETYTNTFDARITLLISGSDGVVIDNLTILPCYYPATITTDLSTVTGSKINALVGADNLKYYYNQIIDAMRNYNGTGEVSKDYIANITVKNCTIGDEAIPAENWGSAIYYPGAVGSPTNFAGLTGGYTIENNVLFGGICICEGAAKDATTETCIIKNNTIHGGLFLNGKRPTGWNYVSLTVFPTVTGNTFTQAAGNTDGHAWFIGSRDGDAAAVIPTGTLEAYLANNTFTVASDKKAKVVVGNYAYSAEATEYYGLVSSEFIVDGEGTENNPYIITNLHELEAFRDAVNAGNNFSGKVFKLNGGINLDVTRAINNWEPIGTQANPFMGTFDGGDNTISNLVVEGENNVGLFGYATSATIKNVKLENVNVKGTDCVGAIAGQVYSTSLIDNCHVSGSIQVEGQTNVGGIVGKYYTKVKNCSVIGDDVATSYVKGTYVASDLEGDNIGGIMGHGGEDNRFENNTVKNITISGTRKVAGIVGVTDMNTQVKNCVVENVNIETTATAEYANSKKNTMSNGTLVGSYTTGNNTTGTVESCVVKNVNFLNPNNAVVSVGPITGGLRGGTDGMLAPTGVTASNNNIYMSTITGSNNLFLMNPVAKIGETEYYTLFDAVAAVQDGETKTITMLRNTAEEFAIDNTTANITLDMAGFTLNGAITPSNAKLTIKNGTINNENASYSAIEINAGTLVLNDVKVTSKRHGVRIDGAVEATINGGEYRLSATSGTRHAVNVSGAANVTITDGIFVGPKGTTMDSGSAVCVQAGAKVTIEGGDFSGGKNATLGVSGTMTVTGGTFDQDVTAYCAQGYLCELNTTTNKYEVFRGLTGEGTEANPYLIKNLSDLVFFRDHVNAGETRYNAPGVWVALANNIDMTDIANWTPIGNVDYNNKYIPQGPVFVGVFNGNGKVISNLKVASTVGGVDTQANVGLFGITGKGAVIKNLTLTNVTINTDGRNVGALAGFAYKATLENITVNGDIQIKGGNNVSGVAGMTRFYAMSATDIAVKGNDGSVIEGNNIIGGITAEIAPNGSTQTFKDLSVENVAIKGVSGVGGIVGLLTLGTVENVSVKDVALTGKTEYQGDAMGRIRLGSVAGLMGDNYATIINPTVENVTAKNLDGNNVVLPIIGANYDASSNATEARIGDTYYATLKHAIAAAQANETTIVMIADAEVSETVKVVAGQKITLDLNGKTISAGWEDQSAGKHIYAFTNNGTLTIKDSSTEANGTINARGNHNYGTMTLVNGTINAIDDNGGYGVCNYDGATFTMNAGTIAATNEDGDTPGNGYDATPVRVESGATFTMNGGVIDNICNFTVAIYNYGTTTIEGGTITSVHSTVANYGTMTIEGGSFTCNGLEGITAHALWAAAGTTTINGGTFDGKDNYNGFNVDASAGATVYITGGNFLQVHSGSLYGEGTIAVSGGTFFDTVPEARCAAGYIPTTTVIDGVTYYTVKLGQYVAKVGNVKYESLQDAVEAVSATDNEIIILANSTESVSVPADVIINLNEIVTEASITAGGNLTFKGNGSIKTLNSIVGGTITVENDKTLALKNFSFGSSDNASATYTITGGTITANYGFFQHGVYALYSNFETGYMYYSYGSDITVYGTFHSEGKGDGLDYVRGKLTIADGGESIHDKVLWVGQPASWGAMEATLIVKQGGYIKANSLSVYSGSALQIDATGLTGGETIDEVECNTLTVEGTVEAINNDKVMAVVEGNKIIIKAKPVMIVETDAYYATLAEAFAAANNQTVKVLQNITLTETVTIAAGKTVTLDLAGYTVSMNYTENATANHTMISNKGDLTIKTSGDGGKISYKYLGADLGTTYSANAVTTNPGSKLTVLSGTIENTTFDNGTIAYAIDGLTNGGLGDVTVNINGGVITSSRQAVRIFANSTTKTGTLNISGGEITGRVIVQNANDSANKAVLEITGGTFNANEYKSDVLYVGGSNSSTIDIDASVSGGTFNGEITDTHVLGFITGGNFSATAAQNTSVDLLAEGFAFNDTPDANGYYTVIQVSGTQTRSLQAGWNWFSSYVDLSQEGGLLKLQTALGESGLAIKGQTENQSVQYVKIGVVEGEEIYAWTGNQNWNPYSNKMYMVRTSAPITVEIEGNLIDYENTTIALFKGWNWISYPLSEPAYANEALTGLTPTEGDQIKAYGANTYIEYSEGEWYPYNFVFMPGEGYMYKAESPNSFVYAKGTTNVRATNKTTENNNWMAQTSEYANNMTITAMLSIDGEVVNDNYEIAAFANGECRGSARPVYIEKFDAYILFMTVYGEEVEDLTFRYYDVNYGTEYELDNRVVYSNDASLGSIKDPYMFTLNITGVDETSMSEINIYPNPTTIGSEINLQATCDKVEVFNALGVKIAEYQNVDTLDAFETAGIYVIRITNDNAVKHCRLVVK